MANPFSGSLILITGASSGIGSEAARQFVHAGARVVGVARSAAPLESLSTELGGGDRFVPWVADVTDAESMRSMASSVLEQIGIPDVIVANAGVGLDARFTETTDEALRKVFEVNVFGLVRSVRPFVSPMVARGGGRILLISSIVGKRGVPNYSAYSASKFALIGIADALRTELYGSGVTVGVVCPSSTDTDFQNRLLREGPAQRRVRLTTHTAGSVARAILRMARSRRPEMVLSAESKLMVLVDTFAPRLVDRILHRILVRRD